MSQADYIRIAHIFGAHGLDGRLKVYVVSDFEERFAKGRTVHMEKDGVYETFVVESCAVAKGRISLLKLQGVSGREKALSYKGKDLFITQSEAESTRPLLDNDSFFYYELIGCDVIREGLHIGTVHEIMEAGAGEVLVIKDQKGKTCYIPFVESMVNTDDIANGRIHISPVDGLIDE